MRVPVVIHRIHRWLGLILGLQIILWLSGGVVMSAIHIDKVRGSDRSRHQEPAPFATSATLLSPVDAAICAELPEFRGARLGRWLGRPVYRLATGEADVMVDAADGLRLSPISAAQARAVAVADYTGNAVVADVRLQEEPLGEIRGARLPIWRVSFADNRHTTIYVSPATGEVTARRNRLWRIYDFFWMLHIMDYGSRDDFNNPLLIVSAAVAWCAGLSGLWLVVAWLQRRWRLR